MIYLVQIIYILATLLLAGKDADSYLLKSKTFDDLVQGRVERWHRDGFLLALLIALMDATILPLQWIWVLGYCTLIRASVFDIAFNKWSSLPVTYIGGTAWTDKLFVKIFGANGAFKKSFLFFLLLVAANLTQYYVQK